MNGELIWSLYKEGKTTNYIAEQIGVSASVIRRYIIDRKNGIRK